MRTVKKEFRTHIQEKLGYDDTQIQLIENKITEYENESKDAKPRLEKLVIEKKKISLCLDYHIKKCEGPCEGMVSEQIYGEMISNVIKFLNGRTNDIENSITEKMNNAKNPEKIVVCQK